MAFLATRLLRVTLFLTAIFFATLVLEATRALERTLTFCGFRAATFFATALLALGRAVLAAGVRLFAADFGEERRATVREVERLRLFVAALISKGYVERPKLDQALRKLRWQSNIASLLNQRKELR